MAGESSTRAVNTNLRKGFWLVSAIRQAGGYSQEALARELGVSFPTVNSWERGRSQPRQAHRRALETLAHSLGIRTDISVLVVDDDPAACAIMEGFIEASPTHAEIHTTTDSSAGLLLCGALDPDLLFLDIMMPGIDGFELARRLEELELGRSTRIIFVTASTDPSVDAEASRAGHMILHKPVHQEVVDELLERIGARELAS